MRNPNLQEIRPIGTQGSHRGFLQALADMGFLYDADHLRLVHPRSGVTIPSRRLQETPLDKLPTLLVEVREAVRNSPGQTEPEDPNVG